MFGSANSFIELTQKDSTKIYISHKDIVAIGNGNNGSSGNAEVSLVSNATKITLNENATSVIAKLPNQLHFISCTTQSGAKSLYLNWEYITGYSSDGQKGTTVYMYGETFKISQPISQIEDYLSKFSPADGDVPSE